ncbi:MAG: hypothetical protein ACFE0J_17445 [Elainellaceae cyanobacterium]
MTPNVKGAIARSLRISAGGAIAHFSITQFESITLQSNSIQLARYLIQVRD